MNRFLCVLAAILPFALVTPSAKASGPSLVVVIAVEQMRADYLTRYGSLFEHGLKRTGTRPSTLPSVVGE